LYEQEGIKRENVGQQEPDHPLRSRMRFHRPWGMAFVLVCCVMAFAGSRFEASGSQQSPAPSRDRRYAIEVSISRNVLNLYEHNGENLRLFRRQYRVGTAVRGLDVYPLGRGRVTAISFNPSWHPTPYCREIFRKRGIHLPPVVPPGHPLNYMGPVKISLSHRTRKGAIYRIHGNNNPGRVGRRVTGGCFVMYNDDVRELARTISVGTEVMILP
jgi:lipoprotein-anchoring transpeptidase ErfK/SrfK